MIRSIFIGCLFLKSLNFAFAAACHLPAEMPSDRNCSLDYELCMNHEKEALRLLKNGANPLVLCKESSTFPLETALQSSISDSALNQLLNYYVKAPLKDPDFIIHRGNLHRTLLQVAIESGRVAAVKTILKRKDLNLNREVADEVGIGTPPATALAFARLRAPEESKARILDLLHRAGARYENCFGVVQLNESNPQGTKLMSFAIGKEASKAAVARILPTNSKTLLVISGHQEGWLKVERIYPNGVEEWPNFYKEKSEKIEGDIWIEANRTRYPDQMLSKHFVRGPYQLVSCVGQMSKTKDSKGRFVWMATTDLQNSFRW